MAFGFTPSYSTDLSLDTVNREQFLVIALDIAAKLNWNILRKSEAEIVAMAPQNFFNRKSRVTISIGDEYATIKSETTGSEMADMGKNKKVVEAFTEAFYEAKYVFSPEVVAAAYEALKPDLDASRKTSSGEASSTLAGPKMSFLSLFVPKKGFLITPVLIYINVALFIVMILSGVSFLSPDAQSLIEWGANFRMLTLDGGWWRLFTCCFLHFGVMHLLLNMYALLFIGLLLEARLGATRFAVAYILTGLVSSVTSLYWHDMTVSAGASGAIFGMYGVFLAMLTTNLLEKQVRSTLLRSIGIFVVYNLLFGLKGGIDNAAHIGGLLSGILIGYIYYPGLKRPGERKQFSLGIAVALVVALGLTILIYRRVPNDLVIYNKKMAAFTETEEAALKVFNQGDHLSNGQFAALIQDSGIYYWNQNIRLLKEVESLNLPAVLRPQTELLIDYCNARIVVYDYAFRKVSQYANYQTDSLEYYDSQVKEILEKIKEK